MLARVLVVSFCVFAFGCFGQDAESEKSDADISVSKAPVYRADIALRACRDHGAERAQIETISVSAPDVARLRAEDFLRDTKGVAPRFAEPKLVDISPETHGSWRTLADGRALWSVRVQSSGSRSLNFGFGEYRMPAGGELVVYSENCRDGFGPFTAADNESHRQLWTPILDADTAIIEVALPASARAELGLRLTSVNRGYRTFGEAARSGSCNVDVVCSEGDGWRDEIRSVAVISTGGSTFCTGFMVNNTSGDRTPYFMTAHHCGIDASAAPSLVTYWNYETSSCGGSPDGVKDTFNTGAVLRATGSASDFTLVELDDPANPEANVRFAGWDATNSVPTSAVAIHHPATDEKRISFEHEALMTTGYGSSTEEANADHLRVIDWDIGTTEPGSSGSPLFDQNHRVVGQLHGGGAACGNDESDWYGWFHYSWSRGLSEHLDAAQTGELAIDGTDVCPAPSVAIAASSTTAEIGEPVTFTSTVSGGEAPYVYAWDVDGDGVTDSTDTELTFVYDSRFEGTARLTVTDNTGCAGVGRAAMAVGRPDPYQFDANHPFKWDDISSVGTPLNLSDDGSAVVDLPFPFSFYGLDYSSVRVNSNGGLTFGSSDSLAYTNGPLPSGQGQLIAALWDDLNPSNGGQVYWHVDSSGGEDRLIVQWHQVRHFSQSTGDGASFQVVLTKGGGITLNYLDVEFGGTDVDGGASATIGVQDSSSFGQQYSFNQSTLQGETSIRVYTE